MVIWQELLTKATTGYECACGKRWGNAFKPCQDGHSGHNNVAARFLSWKHIRQCRHAILYTEYWRLRREAIDKSMPLPAKPQELKDLEDAKWEGRG